MPRALAPRGTNGNGEFIPMTDHVDVKCMLGGICTCLQQIPYNQRDPGSNVGQYLAYNTLE
jgi:hypothetical protein